MSLSFKFLKVFVSFHILFDKSTRLMAMALFHDGIISKCFELESLFGMVVCYDVLLCILVKK